jgi:hypothetical protein
MATRNVPGRRGLPVPKAHNLAALCDPFVKKIRDLPLLTTLLTSTACFRDSFTSFSEEAVVWG